jgi:hypothetical protein
MQRGRYLGVAAGVDAPIAEIRLCPGASFSRRQEERRDIRLGANAPADRRQQERRGND